MMSDKRFPLSLKYDPDWILANSMGSHVLWLQEALMRHMSFRPEMRVLDLGCGKGIGSVFLAREFGPQVWAADLWIDPTENLKLINEMGCGDRVFPIRADATSLPFADDFFDSMISINSLFFYATEEGFLNEHIFRHVKPGGEIGIVVPGFLHEYSNGLPEEYLPYAGFGLDKYHTADWWREHLMKCGMVDVLLCDSFEPDNDGNALFRKSLEIVNAHEEPYHILAWDDLTFTRIVARRK